MRPLEVARDVITLDDHRRLAEVALEVASAQVLSPSGLVEFLGAARTVNKPNALDHHRRGFGLEQLVFDGPKVQFLEVKSRFVRRDSGTVVAFGDDLGYGPVILEVLFSLVASNNRLATGPDAHVPRFA